uniref:Uncharacterized protein n=1 Tax=Rhizophora mucronata TaxID=61149 RepID=A0A2P2R0V4_RHIMU
MEKSDFLPLLPFNLSPSRKQKKKENKEET